MLDDADRPGVDLLDGTFYGGDPWPAFAWMRRHEPVYRDDRNALWGISRHADVKQVSKSPALFSSAGGSRPDHVAMPFMIDMDAPEHHRRRRLVNSGFTPRRVGSAGPDIKRTCDEIIDRVCETGSCDFVRDIAAPLPMIVIGEMLGVTADAHGNLLRWSDQMMKALGSPDPAAMVEAAEAFADYSVYMSERIEERRTSGSDNDLIGTLVHAEIDGDRLDHDSLLFESLLLLVGGDETTRHVLSGGTEVLIRHRPQFEALRRDRSLLPTAVEEMLRWVSPIKNMARTATTDTVLGGQAISAGEQLVLLYPSANRDESVFSEPERFDIERQPNDHVAFGFGTHFCLGNSLARVELACMVDRLLDRLPDLRLASEAELPRRQANFVSGLESMPVEFTPTEQLGRAGAGA